MAQVTASTEIRAAPESVWALMCDPNRYNEWADPTDRMLDVPKEDIGVDFVYREYGGYRRSRAKASGGSRSSSRYDAKSMSATTGR